MGDFKSSRRWPLRVPLDQVRLSPGGHSPGPEAGTGGRTQMRGAPSPLMGHTETRANSVGLVVLLQQIHVSKRCRDAEKYQC